MNRKRNQKGPGGNRPNKKVFGIITVVLWALIITLFINYLFSSYNTSKTIEVPYSEFKQMVMRHEVAKVDLTSNKYVITLKEGIDRPNWSQEYLDTLTEEERAKLLDEKKLPPQHSP